MMPSLEDGMANGLLEGMALGLCPLVTDIFGDILDENSAIIVPRGDADALAGAMQRAASSPHDRARLGRRAKDIIQSRHLPAREAGEYLQLFLSLASSTSTFAAAG